MEALPLHPNLPSISSVIGTSSYGFVETVEYRRFVDLCDACRQYRYIGLCFGPPGVGKSLSALHYSRAGEIISPDQWSAEARDERPIDIGLYTPEVLNSPAGVDSGIRRGRETLLNVATRSIRTEARTMLDRLRLRDETWRREHREDAGYKGSQVPPLEPSYMQAFTDFEVRTKAIADPTSLIIVDEADRLHMLSLEQLPSIFDSSGLGMVLIGMPRDR